VIAPTTLGGMTVDDVSWDLSPLVHGEQDGGADKLLDEAATRAQAFAEAHAGRVKELDAPAFVAAIAELQAISELAARAGNYAMLRFSVDTADPAIGALMQRVQEKSTAIETQLLFFELEWATLCDEHAEALLSADGLDTARHFLRSARRYRPHLLSEPEEKILAEKSVSGASAWGRLHSEHLSSLTVDLPGEEEPVTLDAALARLMASDRDTRRGAAEAVTAALAPGMRTRAFIFNTLLHDKAVDDRLRKYPNWLAARNLANEASDESVQALLSAVRSRYELPRRWYRLKAQLLGIDKLADYDRMAAVTRDDEPVEWEDAKQLVLDSYAAFTPELGDPARAFCDEQRIDAPPRPAKRGGAFAAYTVPSEHPYLMLNYTAKRRDVLILAHEMGHGLHAELARPRGILEQHTPLTLAETASVFGETLVFRRLLEQAATPESRLSLLAESIEGSIATVFRQTAMNRFEELVHTSRRDEGELSVDRFNELWVRSQEEMLGDSVELSEGYRTWWSYVPHFISTPGYVYAYAYGQLLALSIYKRYVDEGEAFVPAYLELLRAGGSKSPEELGAIVGIDLADPGFWDSGLDLVEAQLETAEEAANASLART
jgi:oligoendopeptidase F